MKKIVIPGLILAALYLAGTAGCSKQSEDVLSKQVSAPPCDTSSVKYATDIVQILQANCYECHGNGNSSGSGGILLEGYSNLISWANNGYLAGCVTHASGYIAMPYLQPKLPDCEVNKIVAWIHQGAKNN